MSFLANVDKKHLAQLFVEAYYLLIGHESSVNTIVVALTSVAVTHYFKLKLPSTRASKRHIEVVWHRTVQLKTYPPADVKHLSTFVDYVHMALDEVN